MAHSGNHEQPIEIGDRSRRLTSRVRKVRKKCPHALVIIDRAERGDRRIAPAVILEKLAAFGAKRPQIRACGVQNGAGLGITKTNIAVEVELAKVPLRILEHRLSIICIAEIELDRVSRSCRRDPSRPRSRRSLGPRGISWKNLLTC